MIHNASPSRSGFERVPESKDEQIANLKGQLAEKEYLLKVRNGELSNLTNDNGKRHERVDMFCYCCKGLQRLHHLGSFCILLWRDHGVIQH